MQQTAAVSVSTEVKLTMAASTGTDDLFACWDNAIDPSAAAQLETEARALWTMAGGDRSSAKSFWVNAASTPRCALERLALDVAKFHFSKPSAWKTVVGAEFWIQMRSSDDQKRGMEFHFDKDEKALVEYNAWAHPAASSATYLTNGGAPIVVFSTANEDGMDEDSDDDEEEAEDSELEETLSAKSNRDRDRDRDRDTAVTAKGSKRGREIAPSNVSGDSDDSSSCGDEPPSDAWIAFPVSGRHVRFDGHLLHGVPYELLDLDMIGPSESESGSARSNKPARKKQRGNVNVPSKSREGNGGGHRNDADIDAIGAYQSTTRLSVLVNVWTSHQPEQVTPLTKKMLKTVVASPSGNAGAGAGAGARAGAAKVHDVHVPSRVLSIAQNLNKAKGSKGSKGCKVTPLAPINVVPISLPSNGKLKAKQSKEFIALSEHRPGDTALLPLEPLVAARMAAAAATYTAGAGSARALATHHDGEKQGASVVHVKYAYT